jgi:hypothetical protein
MGVTLLGPDIYTVKETHKTVKFLYLIIRAAGHFLVFYYGFEICALSIWLACVVTTRVV